MANPEMLQMAI